MWKGHHVGGWDERTGHRLVAWENQAREDNRGRGHSKDSFLPHSLCHFQLAATIDLFPTIAKLTGAAMPNNVTIDGIDMSPFLFENGTVKHSAYVCCMVRSVTTELS